MARHHGAGGLGSLALLGIFLAGCGGGSGSISSDQATAAVLRIYRANHPALRVTGLECIKEEGKDRTFDCDGTVTRPHTNERTSLQLIALASEDGRHFELTDATDYAAVAPPPPPALKLPTSVPKTDFVSEGILKPLGSEQGTGIGVILVQGGQHQLVVQAKGLKPTTSKSAYEVWLYNSQSDAKPMGAQFTDKRGDLQGRGDVPANYASYKYVMLSRERVGTNPQSPSDEVLLAKLGAVH